LLLSSLNISRDAYAILQEFPSLEGLNMRPANSLPRAADGTSWLKYVEGLDSLKHLGIDNTDITDADMDHLLQLPALRNLVISGTKISDAGVARLKGAPSLRWIDAQSTNITESGAAQLPGISMALTRNKQCKIISAERGIKSDESDWQEYVRRFIETYSLNESQQNTAHSILREMCDQAARYRRAHADDFARVDQKLTRVDATGGRDNNTASGKATASRPLATNRIRSLLQERDRLEQPVTVDMFNRLKERLDRIPTQAQRRPGP
jgi:hypothetical protein